ncbi:pyruvate kinase [Schleiferilactobacillus harbinensis]|uniref:pyruvate kinase n=1 Tax=Schleiferilactobacillus harbinensis TaxID=304207 RepID=UPI0021A90D44|nr:pyruvate kinase [Schleiferilactobacillus harbinensis]
MGRRMEWTKIVKTKIVMKLGLPVPAEQAVREYIRAGATVFSVDPNMGTSQDLDDLYTAVQQASAAEKAAVGILLDLPVTNDPLRIERNISSTEGTLLTRIDRALAVGAAIIAIPVITNAVYQAIWDLARQHPDVLILGKIASAANITDCPDILKTYDGLLIDRDHLAREIPVEDVPEVEQSLIQQCLAAGKPVITAGQMLSSLMMSSRPSRGDVTDVAYAVVSGTDAVYLSEAASRGGDPAGAVAMLNRINNKAATMLPSESPLLTQQPANDSITETTATQAVVMTRQAQVKAIVTITSAGFTARQIARYKPQVPVIAVTAEPIVAAGLQLSWGIDPLVVANGSSREAMIQEAENVLAQTGVIQIGDAIVVVAGYPFGQAKDVNNVTIHEYGVYE